MNESAQYLYSHVSTRAFCGVLPLYGEMGWQQTEKRRDYLFAPELIYVKRGSGRKSNPFSWRNRWCIVFFLLLITYCMCMATNGTNRAKWNKTTPWSRLRTLSSRRKVWFDQTWRTSKERKGTFRLSSFSFIYLCERRRILLCFSSIRRNHDGGWRKKGAKKGDFFDENEKVNDSSGRHRHPSKTFFFSFSGSICSMKKITLCKLKRWSYS